MIVNGTKDPGREGAGVVSPGFNPAALSEANFGTIYWPAAMVYAPQGLKGSARRFNAGYHSPLVTAVGLTPFHGGAFSLDVPGVETPG
jgi:hypothetical protein